MSNNNFLWETILSDIKKDIPEKVFETWFLHSSIDKVDFVKKQIHLLSKNNLISDYLKNMFDSKIKLALKNNTAIDFTIFYNYLENNNIIEDTSFSNTDLFSNSKFLSNNKPSGMQNFIKQPEFIFEEKNMNYQESTIIPSKKNPSLKKHFTFDNFVQGEGNIYAFNIAKIASEYPGNHNPIFIYGGVGLGKTHLLNAIGNELETNYPDYKIECISSEKFLNDFLKAIVSGKNSKNNNVAEDFHNKYRNVDALLIDDIQFLSDKTGTQTALFHTFNELQLNNKQIVLVSDRPPSQIDKLEDRLVSRFDSGIVVDITPPDFETRAAIIKFKCTQSNLSIEDSLIKYIASNVPGNIRELEGILKDIELYSSINNANITLEIIENILKRRAKNTNKKVNTDNIINIVSDYFKINVNDILSSKRNKEVVFPRMIAIYLCRELTELSLPSIGKLFNKDHSSIFYSVSKIASQVSENENNINEILEEIKNKII